MDATGRRLLGEVPVVRRHLAVSVVAGVLAGVCVVAQALLLAHVIAGAVSDGAGLADMTEELFALVAVTIARAALAGAFELSGDIAAAGASAELRGRLARALLSARPVAVHGARQGDLAAAATSGLEALAPFYARYLPQLVLAVCVPAAVLAAVVRVDVRSALVMAVTVPLIPIFMVLIGTLASARTRSRWRSLRHLSGHFLDVVRGLGTLVAHNRADAQLGAVRVVGDHYRVETMATLRIAFLSALVLEGLAMLGTALVAVTVGVRLAGGGLTFEAGLAVLILAPELYAPLRQLGAQFHASADGIAAAETVFSVLDLPPAVGGAGLAAPVPSPADGPVELSGVSVTYPGADTPALDGVDLVLSSGELVAVVGSNGSGKTTLGLVLVRLVAPTAGAIRVAGVDLASVDPDGWRANVAWVPQRPRLFPGTLEDNVRLGRPEAGVAAVQDALGRAGLVSLLPALDVRLGEGGRGLSVGERRRVAIARALLRDAHLVVLDEPTADLDAETAALVGEAVAGLAAGRTVLLISHDPALAARADRIVELERGRVVRSSLPVGDMA